MAELLLRAEDRKRRGFDVLGRLRLSVVGADNGAYRVHSNGARVTSVQEWLYRVLGIRPYVPKCVNSGGALQRRLGIQAAQEHFQRQGGAIEVLAE